MLITKRQSQILIGTLLGDGHLEKNGNGARLKFGHGLPQRDYIMWKYEELKNLATSKPRFVQEFYAKANKQTKAFHFSTFSSVELMKWRGVFYKKDGTKITPRNIGDLLKSPLSLAVWYMDDGYKRNDCNALRISTDAFSLAEHKLLIDCLYRNFSIKSVIHKKAGAYNIYIPQASAQSFCDLVRPHIIDSLLYKVSLTP